ncbi:unnamed protein product [Adineta ricciae]|uniref:NAD(P)(+)--arginine ADP-ribosyltransferase n=1 Tax=Adineta ricciae TaxID=249248 RepID=A0A814XB46_ADIRI|nr:unnamed protein product [Adineta ricciae]
MINNNFNTPSSFSRHTETIESSIVTWLCLDENECHEDSKHMKVNLQNFGYTIENFNDTDECIDFITTFTYKKHFLIISGLINEYFLLLIHDIPQIISIYILHENGVRNEAWSKELIKVKGYFPHMEHICNLIQEETQWDCYQSDSISIFSPKDISNQRQDILPSEFMYSQLLKDTFLILSYDDKSRTEFSDALRQTYAQTDHDLRAINDFETNYYQHSPIWWYTKESFLYVTLNRALRMLDLDMLLKMSFFMRDLHQQIEQLHCISYNQQQLMLYRGQGMSNLDFEKLKQSENGLLSFNNFLSTSTDREVSFHYADSVRSMNNTVGILFEMEINPPITSTRFATLDNISYYGDSEKEVLFSTHAIFRVTKLEQLEDQLWQVQLRLTNDTDVELKQLTDYFEKGIKKLKGIRRLASLLTKMGQYGVAEAIYQNWIKKTPSDDWETLADLYYEIACTKKSMGEFSLAFDYFKKSIDLQEKYLRRNDFEMGNIYNSLAGTYKDVSDYDNALLFYQKALTVHLKHGTDDKTKLASIYNNIGLVYMNVKEHMKALSYFQKSLEKFQGTVPDNHPDLATTYDNMAQTYIGMNDAINALPYSEKALDIHKKTLPSNHPLLATTYNNIGVLYSHLKDTNNALLHYQKAVEIMLTLSCFNCQYLAGTYRNIAQIHIVMEEFMKALSFLQESLDVCQKTGSFSIDEALTLQSIGDVYQIVEEYELSLPYYQKALDIYNQFPLKIQYQSYEPYIGMGVTYGLMENYAMGISCLDKALEYYQKSSTDNPKDEFRMYSYMGKFYMLMGKDSNAISYWTKVLEINQVLSALDQSDVASMYDFVGKTHYEMKNYSAALVHYKKALEVKERTFSCENWSLRDTYKRIAEILIETGDLLNALSYFKKLIEIYETSENSYLFQLHFDLCYAYGMIGRVYNLLKQFKESLIYYEKVLQIVEKNLYMFRSVRAFANRNVGLAHSHVGNYSTSLIYLKKYIEIEENEADPDYKELAIAYNSMGMSYMKLHDYANANLYFDKARRKCDEWCPLEYRLLSAIYFHLAQVLERLHDYPTAIQHANTAVELSLLAFDPNHPEVKANQVYLEKLYKYLS